MIAEAIAIAATAHSRQYDKGGDPYILHCIRVMQKQESAVGQIVAVLHDVLEDCDEQYKLLILDTFGEAVYVHLCDLTRGKNQDYLEDYIDIISRCSLCTEIKLADLEDNLNILRQPTLRDKDLLRLQKYHIAYRKLTQGKRT